MVYCIVFRVVGVLAQQHQQQKRCQLPPGKSCLASKCNLHNNHRAGNENRLIFGFIQLELSNWGLNPLCPISLSWAWLVGAAALKHQQGLTRYYSTTNLRVANIAPLLIILSMYAPAAMLFRRKLNVWVF
jgi:hypothetical protein